MKVQVSVTIGDEIAMVEFTKVIAIQVPKMVVTTPVARLFGGHDPAQAAQFAGTVQLAGITAKETLEEAIQSVRDQVQQIVESTAELLVELTSEDSNAD